MVNGEETRAKLKPVHKRIEVDLPVETAFELFTQGIANWWPLETHSVGEDQSESCVFEGRVGGRIYEILTDGSESDWGQVKTWDPPAKVVFSWHPGRGESSAQEVEVLFRSVESGTEVELTHSGWELLGDRAVEMRDSYDGGWEYVLGRYLERSKQS